MTRKLSVRKAGPDDLKLMTGFIESLFSIEKDFSVNSGRIERGLMEIIYGGGGKAFVSEFDGKPIGMATAQLVVSTAAGGYSVLIEDVFIMQSHRGMGAGKMLMEYIKDWAMTKGALRMQLVTDANNNEAVEFYKNLGWYESNMKGMYIYL